MKSKKSKKNFNQSNSFIGNCWNKFKKFWNFIWYDDSLSAYLLNFIVAFIFIKFIFFPALGFVLNNDYPIVAIVSGSMEHNIVKTSSGYEVCDKIFLDSSMKGSLDVNSWWSYCGDYYEMNYNLSSKDFENYPYKNGLNVGDVMVLYGEDPVDIEVGEILVFIPNSQKFFLENGPVIHRVVEKWEEEDGFHFKTKGDHNSQSFTNFEEDISEDQVLAVAKFRVPFIGYVKIAFSKFIGYVGGLF